IRRHALSLDRRAEPAGGARRAALARAPDRHPDLAGRRVVDRVQAVGPVEQEPREAWSLRIRLDPEGGGVGHVPVSPVGGRVTGYTKAIQRPASSTVGQRTSEAAATAFVPAETGPPASA